MKKFLKYALFIFCCFFAAVLISVIIATAIKLISCVPTIAGQAAGLLGFIGLISLVVAGVVCVIER